MNNSGATPIRTKSYLSDGHLHSAIHLANLARAEESDGKPTRTHRAYVTSSILLSVAFLEGTINEVFSDAADDDTMLGASRRVRDAVLRLSKLGLVEKSSLRILERYEMFLLLLDKPALDRGREPSQSVELVIKLRNHLVHFVPVWCEHNGEEQKLEKGLKGRFPIDARFDRPGCLFFPSQCLSAGCAAWAVQSCVAFVDEFFRVSGLRTAYLQIRHDIHLPSIEF